MKWKCPKQELPEIKFGNNCRRCLAECVIVKNSNEYYINWIGFLDVAYDPSTGWNKNEDDKQVKVLRWIYYEEIENAEQFNNDSISLDAVIPPTCTEVSKEEYYIFTN